MYWRISVHSPRGPRIKELWKLRWLLKSQSTTVPKSYSLVNDGGHQHFTSFWPIGEKHARKKKFWCKSKERNPSQMLPIHTVTTINCSLLHEEKAGFQKSNDPKYIVGAHYTVFPWYSFDLKGWWSNGKIEKINP